MDRQQIINSINSKISSSSKIILTIDGRLDADAVGSALALAIKFQELGKEIEVISDTPLRFPYTEFTRAQIIKTVDILNYVPTNPDLVIVTDTSNPQKLISENRPKMPIKWINDLFVIQIDHHGDGNFGNLSLVDSSANSTTQLVLELLKPLGITPEIATLLYAGLVADTINFRTIETNAKTFATAKELMSSGADHTKVRYWLESYAFEALNVIGKLIQRVQLSPTFSYVLLTVPYEFCIKYETTSIDNAMEILKDDLLWRVRETDFVVTLKEPKPGFTKGSLRGNKNPHVDLRVIARALGGGGHPQGCGFKIEAPIEQAQKLITKVITEEYSHMTII